MKAHTVVVLLLAAALAATGCSSPECTSSTDCGAGLACENEKCVEPVAEGCSPVCSGEMPICDQATRACVTCTATEGCASGLVCDVSAAGGRCVACLDSTQCSGATPVCDPATQSCIGCLANADCAGQTPVCDPATRTCVGCLDSSDCQPPTELCIEATHTCVPCASAGGCIPTIQVLSARSLSSTEVEVTFDQLVDSTSVAADGSQFSFSAGLTASAASATGSLVRVTTSAQTPGATYTVTVAATVRGGNGSPVSAPGNSAQFTAPLPSARLVINEINPNIPESHDLIELLVTEAGTTKQLAVMEEGKTDAPLTFATFPDVAVQVGDIVVLHLNPTGDEPHASERESKNESTAPGAFPNAWDFVGGSAGVTFSHRVIKVVAPDGTVQDAVAFAKTTLTDTPPGGFVQAVANAQGDGQWLPADCSGEACTYESSPSVLDVSADWSAVGNTRSSSMSRVPGQDTNSAADWVLKESGATFGSPND
jgi:hypothetical protein